MKSLLYLSIILLLWVSGCNTVDSDPIEADSRKLLSSESVDKKTTAELLELAEQTLRQAREDNIAATKHVHHIFAAADRLLEEYALKESKHYFEKGLQISPWNLDAQLSYSKVLLKFGETEKAKRVAKLVFQTSERQSLLEEASQIAGIQMPTTLATLPDKVFKDKVFCFVPIGDVQDWVLSKSGIQLSQVLGVEVYSYDTSLSLPDPHRSYYVRWTDRMKKNIVWEHPWIVKQMNDIGIQSSESANAEQVLELLARIDIVQGKEDPRPKFTEYIENAKERDQQWDAAILLEILMQQITPKENVVYIGVTEADMYNNDNTFLFGLAKTGSNFALLSYCRYRAWFHRERESQSRLLDRIHKQLLSSAGFALGIPRPTDPRSARSYPNGLDDHDLKGTWLAPECVEGFERALGHTLPKRTKDESNNRLETTPEAAASSVSRP